ncbi:MFS transporter [Dactylosporangium vinaceum]|uniref:MFS transporter n=1 Tax=Dactylosporangium vinaceum TaxID=53362 RepID=A0ABV5M8D6_9ACTN|nr:MFS transporter [Dactylosporangium vinaceum]
MNRHTITLLMLYVTQYIGVGFITIGLVAILRAGGTPLETLGALTLIGLVWPLKVLWAPLLDRYGSRSRGHYRSWLLVLQSGLVVTLLALLPFDPPGARLGAVVLVCTVYVLLSATQDIAVDAIAVRLLAQDERGTGNGVQLAGVSLGTVLGGGVCLVAYDRLGWAAAVLLLAGLTAAGLVTVWRFREPERLDRLPGAGDAYRALLSVFGQPGARQWTFVVVSLLYVGSGAAWALVTPALVDAGWSEARIGTVTGVVVSIPAVVAGLVAGGLVGRFGRGRVLAGAGSLLALAALGLLPLLGGAAPAAGTVLALCAFMAAYTAVNVVVYTVNMDYSRPRTGGTDFTMLSAVGLAVSFVAASAGLAAAAWIGYPAVAAGSVAVLAGGIALGLRHQRRHGPAPVPAPQLKDDHATA